MLKRASEPDREMVRVWRNHPDVRAVSLNQATISEEEHSIYWSTLEGRKDRLVYIFYDDEAPVGIVTYSDIIPGESATWGYFLDLDVLRANGRLLISAVQLYKEALTHAFDTLRLEKLTGEVLGTNQVSYELSLRFGFREIQTEPRMIDGNEINVRTLVVARSTYLEDAA